MRFFNQEMSGINLPLTYPIFLVFFGAIFAFVYKRIIQGFLNRFMVYNALTYILTFLCIVTVIFIYINIMTIDQSNFYENVKSNLFLFLIFFILLIISLFIILFLAFQRYKIKQREEELKNFESYIASIEQINQDMRKFKHDYVNMLTSLKTFIDDKNYRGLQTYFYEHILEMNHQEQLNEQALMMLNNLKVDSLKGLFTTKIIQAQAKQIPFFVEVVEEIIDIPTDPIVLNRMIGILLDNAIEAAMDADDKEVRVAIIQMNESVLIVINNTYDTSQDLKVHELFEEGFSTKGKNRGLGLSTLREMKDQFPNINIRTKIHPPLFTQELEFRKEKP
ncbi:sensor histidine kinase [Sporosarcina ureilytica]|nr:GHKL domain-containing protein [Sporosarcina ureilytica]